MRILFVLILFVVLAQSVPLNWVVKFRLLKPVLLDYLNEYESEKNADIAKLIENFQQQNQSPNSVTIKELSKFLHATFKINKSDDISMEIFKEVLGRMESGFPGAQKVIVEFPMDSGEAKIDKIAIDRILKRAELKDRQIVAVSIVGAYRKGKSFILNYFLRYLYFTYQSLNLLHRGRFEPRSEKWYQLTDESLKGFSWKDGVERHTTGIVLWSDVFLYESDSEKYAIILIDTQGLFDHDTPDEINSKIFSFTTLISSIQIYNLPNIIHENELQYLQFATEFAKYSMNDECVGKPFGHLLFLIRDWASTSSYNYGFDDGLKYLEEHVLKIKRHQPENMIELRRHIRDSYEKIQCFLMPHPGKIVHVKNFNGSYIGLDEEFLKQLDVLVPGILSPENLQPKKVNGRHITVSDFLSNFNSYSSLFNDKNIPSALSVYESTVNIFMNQLVTKNINFYSNEVQRHLSSIKDLNEFQNIHLKVKESAVDKYTDARKMGSKDQVKSFENLFYHEIDKAYVKLNSTAATIINQKEAKSNNNGLITFIGVLGVLGIAAAVFG